MPGIVYTLKKEELQQELQNRGLDIQGTVEELRKRLSQALREEKASGELPLASTEGADEALTSPGSALKISSEVSEPQNLDRLSVSRGEKLQALHLDIPKGTYESRASSNFSPRQTFEPPPTQYPTGPSTSGGVQPNPRTGREETLISPALSPRRPTENTTTIAPRSLLLSSCLPQSESHLTDANVMDKVRKWNVKYDGGQDPLGFLERVEELASCYEIPLRRIYKALPELLTKNALAWYRNNREYWTGWDNFVEDFKQFFLPPRYHVKLADEIRSRVQKPGEKTKDYVTAMQSLMRWHPKMTAEDRIERIYDNLRPEYRFYIRRRDFQTLSELVKLAEEFESLKTEEKREQKIPSNQQKPPMPTRTNYSREECCWRCGQRGHTRGQCRNPIAIFCSRCGRQGMMSRECPCSRPPTTNQPPPRNQFTPNRQRDPQSTSGNEARVSERQGNRAPEPRPQ